MADIKKESILFSMTEETTPGTPASVSSGDFMELTQDGATVNGPLEKIETNTLNGSRMAKKSKKTIQNGDFSGAVYLRASETAGGTPEIDKPLRASGWEVEAVSTKTTLLADSTTTVLKMSSLDSAKYKVGQGILIDGKYKNCVKAIASGEITLLKALSSAPAAGVEIEKLKAYRLTGESEASFTVRKWFAGKVKQEVPGGKVGETSVTITAGQVPQFNFSGEGLNFSEVLETLGISPSFSNAEYPAAIEACLLVDGSELESNEFSATHSQDLAKKPTLCATNVNKSIKGTNLMNISGSMSVYKKDDEVTLLPSDSVYSIFISVHVPAGSSGEKSGVVTLFYPRVKIDERDSNGDINGLSSMSINWTCEPTLDESTCPVITFI